MVADLGIKTGALTACGVSAATAGDSARAAAGVIAGVVGGGLYISRVEGHL